MRSIARLILHALMRLPGAIVSVFLFVATVSVTERVLAWLADFLATLRHDVRRERPGVVTRIDAIVGDLTRAPTEAIVNAANSELWMGGGVAGVIKQVAGQVVESEAMAQGPIQPGEAVATSAGQLRAPIRWVIHAATMGPDLQTSEGLVRSATASALAKAKAVGAKSIALPAMGTGVGNLPMATAALVMVDEARKATASETSLEWIVFVLRDKEAWQLFDQQIGAGGRSGPPRADEAISDEDPRSFSSPDDEYHWLMGDAGHHGPE